MYKPENEPHKILGDFKIQTDLGQETRTSDNSKKKKKKEKKRTYRIVDFAVSADHRVKIKESMKSDNNLDLARKLRRLWNMRVTVIPTVIGELGMLCKAWKENWKSLKSGRIVTI